MGLFATTDDVRATLWQFLSMVTADAELRPKFVEANGIVLSDFTDPDCSILMDLSQDPPVVTWAPEGADRERAEVILTMTAENAHLFWLGELNATIALARKRIKVKGSISKMMKLLPALGPAHMKYREFLETNGHFDKIPQH